MEENPEKKEEDLKFPIEFKQCPCCGSTKRIAQTIIDEQIKKGLAGKDTIGASNVTNAVIWDQRKILLSVPILTCFEDICLMCGTKYCIKAVKGQGQAQMGKPGKGGFQLPPNIPYGRG